MNKKQIEKTIIEKDQDYYHVELWVNGFYKGFKMDGSYPLREIEKTVAEELKLMKMRHNE